MAVFISMHARTRFTDPDARRMHRTLHRHAAHAAHGLCPVCFKHRCPEYIKAWNDLISAGVFDEEYADYATGR